MRPTKLTIIATLIAFTTLAFAQQSEFQSKLQEDLDSYKKYVIANCGTSENLAAKWTGGKLAGNPRESVKPEWYAVSTLCTFGFEAVSYACTNKVVNAKLSKVTTVACKMGKGTMDYKLSGTTLTIAIDPSYTKDNAAGQRDTLTAKIKKQLDD